MVTYAGTDEDVVGQNNLNIDEHEIVCIGLYAVDDPGTGTSMIVGFMTNAEIDDAQPKSTGTRPSMPRPLRRMRAR